MSANRINPAAAGVPDDDYSRAAAALWEALARVRLADPAARGWVSGTTLDLSTALTAEQAAAAIEGLRPPPGCRFQWRPVGGDDYRPHEGRPMKAD